MSLAAEGHSDDELAERLYVSSLTVRTHIHRAMTKPGARDMAQLVVMAYQSGLVQGVRECHELGGNFTRRDT